MSWRVLSSWSHTRHRPYQSTNFHAQTNSNVKSLAKHLWLLHAVSGMSAVNCGLGSDQMMCCVIRKHFSSDHCKRKGVIRNRVEQIDVELKQKSPQGAVIGTHLWLLTWGFVWKTRCDAHTLKCHCPLLCLCWSVSFVNRILGFGRRYLCPKDF